MTFRRQSIHGYLRPQHQGSRNLPLPLQPVVSVPLPFLLVVSVPHPLLKADVLLHRDLPHKHPPQHHKTTPTARNATPTSATSLPLPQVPVATVSSGASGGATFNIGSADEEDTGFNSTAEGNIYDVSSILFTLLAFSIYA